MTGMAPSSQWRGETGFINSEMLAKYLSGAAAPVYYIAGPPQMVKGLRSVLKEKDVDDDEIRTEEFAGY